MNLGIVLSGGGIRGIAHLGVLKALKEKKITVSRIAGTSAGSIAGALYANQVDPYDALKIFQNARLLKILKIAYGQPAFLNLESTYNFFKQYLPQDSFDSLSIPLTITATNYSKGNLEYFDKGDHLIKKMLASCCIPGVFNPIKIDGSLYVDGGVLNNFPIEPLLGKCDLILGSSCNHLPTVSTAPSIKKVLERTATLAVNHSMSQKSKNLNLLIEPHNLGNIGVFEVNRAEEIFWLAHEEALKQLEKSDLFSNTNKK